MVYVCTRYCSGRIVLCHPRLILELLTTENKKMVTVLDLSTMEDKKMVTVLDLSTMEDKKNGHHLDFSTVEVL